MSRLRADKTQLQAAYERVKHAPQWAESCALIATGKAPSEMFAALAVRPDILLALSAFSGPLHSGSRLEREVQERVIVAVSEANRCQYCAASHSGSLERLGLGETEPSPRAQAALAYTAAAVANPPAITDSVWDAARDTFDDEEILELTVVIGLTCMLNRINDCLGVRYNGEYDKP